jgi:hypothetical protein
LTLSSASVSAIASRENPTFNIIKYAYEQLTDMVEFEEYGNISDENGLKLVPIIPANPYPAGAVGPLLLDPLTNPDQFLITYDDFIKSRSGGMRYFYPVKSIQSRIKVSIADFSKMILFRNRLIEVLDREDAAAEDLNKWMSDLHNGNQRIFFHCINAYQTTYLSDATTMDDQRNVFSGDIIIKADYHIINSSYK